MRDIWCVWIVRVLSAAQESFVDFKNSVFLVGWGNLQENGRVNFCLMFIILGKL